MKSVESSNNKRIRVDSNSASNSNSSSLVNPSPPTSVDLNTLAYTPLPDDWSSEAGAKRACKGEQSLGRLIGHVEFTLINIDAENFSFLTSQYNTVIPVEARSRGICFDQDGEYFTQAGRLTVSRIMDLQREKLRNKLGFGGFFLNKSRPNQKIEVDCEIECDDSRLLSDLYALQSPQSSPWGRPLGRPIASHEYDASKKTLHVRFHIYFSRLVFELIADDAVRRILERVTMSLSLRVIPKKSRPPQPQLFTTSEAKKNPHFRWSLAGLMQHAENSGYTPLPESQQPARLAVPLFPFQLSTVQWMLDQERDEGGINSFFWEEWHSTNGDGFSAYYFRLAGDLRLVKPPK